MIPDSAEYKKMGSTAACRMHHPRRAIGFLDTAKRANTPTTPLERISNQTIRW